MKRTCDSKYKKELDKACFALYVACSNSKNLSKGTVSDKILKERAYEIAINPKYNRYQRGLASIMYKCFDKNHDQEDQQDHDQEQM